MVSIGKYVDKELMNRITALSGGNQETGQAVAQALKGGGESAINKISRATNFAAQAYAKSLTGINFAGSAVNLATSDLSQLSELTKEAIIAVQDVVKPNTARTKREDASLKLYELGKKFNTIIEGAEIGGKKYLSSTGLEEIFINVGLDPQESKSIGQVFDKFINSGKDNLFANTGIKSDKDEALNNPEELFSLGRPIRSSIEAKSILDDLTALNNQIDTNLETLNEVRVELIGNASLVRSAAIAFGEISGDLQGIEDAEDLAKEVRSRIVRSSGQALTHADNLEPLIVAALTFDEKNLLS